MDITNIPRYDYDKRHWKKIIRARRTKQVRRIAHRDTSRPDTTK